MKVSYVEVAGFRGFKSPVRFDFPAGFVVLTGRNGVGKSTVLDAIDFALTGTINKFTVKGVKGGGLGGHIWWVGDGEADAHYVEVGFIRSDGHEVKVNRSRDRGLNHNEAQLRDVMCMSNVEASSWPETLMRTTLIRDETLASLSLDLPEQARFEAVRVALGAISGPDHSGRTAALVQAAIAAKTRQDARLGELQAELGRTLSGLTEARSIAERQSDVSTAEATIRSLISDLDNSPEKRAEQLRHWIAERKMSIEPLEAAISRAETALSDERYYQSDEAEVDETVLRLQIDNLEDVLSGAQNELAAATAATETERSADALAAHLVALLEHGEALGLRDGHCPLCDASRSDAEFASAVTAARSRLRDRGAGAARAAERLAKAQAALSEANKESLEAKESLSQLELRRRAIAEALAEVRLIFEQHGFQGDPSDPEASRTALLRRQDETATVEHAAFVLEASAAHDRVSALEGRVGQLRETIDQEVSRASAANRAVEAARQIDSAAKQVANQILTEQFDTVMPLLKELYQRLRPHADWREIETDFGGKVRASLNFSVGDGKNPQFLFSSGQRRAAGLSFLLAIHLSRPWCRLQSLLLDDPVQHIDDYRALNLVEVLSAIRRTGRQIVIAVEDAALADLLCRRLRSTANEAGCRFELAPDPSGAAKIESRKDIFPLPSGILRLSQAS